MANPHTQSYQFRHDTAAGRWSWSTVQDVSGVAPTYRVEAITSPYGVLRDSIPIPGEVVEAMSDSITEIGTQFPPSILIGATTLTFSAAEGEGFTDAQDVSLTNNGEYGSLLTTTLTSSASYVTATPASLGSLALNQTGTFEVAVDSSTLLTANSPYAEVITIQDARASNSPQTLPITINVLPKAIIAMTPAALAFTAIKPLTGAFDAVASQTFVIENTGPATSVLSWQLQRVIGGSDWLTGFGPVSGSLGSGETETIIVSVAPPANQLKGTYTETLRVSGYSDNQFVDVELTLTIS